MNSTNTVRALSPAKRYRIGDLARRTGTPVDTIRYYERQGVLPAPARSEGNFRLYEAGHEQRLRLIRRCRSLDMTLDEIRLLLRAMSEEGADCGPVNELLDEHIAHVRARIRELQALMRELQGMREQCIGDSRLPHCPIIQSLEAARPSKPGPMREAAAHVQGSHGTHPQSRHSRRP